MNANIQATLDKVLGALPADAKDKALNCKSKEEFMGLISPDMLGGLLGGGAGDKGEAKASEKADANPLGNLLGGDNPLGGLLGGGDNNPLGGLLQNAGSLIPQAGDFLKGVDWSEILAHIKQFFGKK